jgi:hypothetical protein
LALTQNYGELTKLRLARRAKAVSSEAFLPIFDLSSAGSTAREKEEDYLTNSFGNVASGPVRAKRPMASAKKVKPNRPIRRSSF